MYLRKMFVAEGVRNHGFSNIGNISKGTDFSSKKKRFFNYARHIQVSKLALPKIDKLKLHHGIETLRSDECEGNENVKTSIRFDKKNNNFARARHFSVHFYAVAAQLGRENA